MSLEQQLFQALQAISPRVFPDFAPAGTALPFVTWQQFGGEAPVFLDNTLPQSRNAWVQINVWAASRIEAGTIMQQIEAALCASTVFIARPRGAMQSAISQDDGIRGAQQDFSIWANR